jgi:asparagine synthetase B (glutamine-hydrolysing)
MPGLFGCIALGDSRAFERDAGERLLSEMGARLAHDGHEKFDMWSDPRGGLAVGRCGARAASLPWPDAAAAAPTFLYGVLHEPAAAEESPPTHATRLRSLRGFFACAALEREPRRFVLAVDRHASHPIAFAVAGQRLYFAPEAKALLAVADLPRRPNAAALGLFFGGGYALSDQTLFAGVDRLCGGEMLVIDARGWRREAYWRYQLRDGGDGTPAADLERELGELLRAAVARNFSRPERSYVLLSGGADSRAIAATASALLEGTGTPLRTVSWTFGVAGPESDEPTARALAAALDSDHTWLPRDVGRFGRDFTRLAYILEGLSDTPASHPYEMEMTRRMSERGVDCVLRGDECFGWGNPVATVEDALSELGLRRLDGASRTKSLLQPDAFESWNQAGAAALEALAGARRGQHAETARDELYFSHRLQGLLNSIAYAKLVVSDHRNPLLDEAIVEFNGRVPTALRRDKALFRRACARSHPRLWALPFAKQQNLVPWKLQLSSQTPARRFLAAQLGDGESAVWEYFRRDAVRALFEELRPASTAAGAGLRGRALRSARSVLGRVPAVERRIRSQYQRHVFRIDDFFLRFLTVKAFVDLHLTAGGDRRTYEERLDRAVALDRMSEAGHA